VLEAVLFDRDLTNIASKVCALELYAKKSMSSYYYKTCSNSKTLLVELGQHNCLLI